MEPVFTRITMRIQLLLLWCRERSHTINTNINGSTKRVRKGIISYTIRIFTRSQWWRLPQHRHIQSNARDSSNVATTEWNHKEWFFSLSLVNMCVTYNVHSMHCVMGALSCIDDGMHVCVSAAVDAHIGVSMSWCFYGANNTIFITLLYYASSADFDFSRLSLAITSTRHRRGSHNEIIDEPASANSL